MSARSSHATATEVRPPITPFLKWAGGKRWLAQSRPDLFENIVGRYIEPFVGSAAIFFCIRPKKALLSDANRELIDTYKMIAADWRAVHKALKARAKAHCDRFYYEERAQSYEDAVERAARFIYLNRTCWNGLYRVNLRGEFNVPRGTKDSVLLDTDDFPEIAAALANATLRTADFEATIEKATSGDLVFLDPPYTVQHNNNGFVKYNERLFSWEDQIRLRQAIERAASRGARCVMTNADHKSLRNLYKGLGRHSTLHRASVIAADSGNRGHTSELLVVVE